MTIDSEPKARRRLGPALIPVIFFVALAALFWKGLFGDPATLPSALIGKPAPEFSLPPVPGLDVPGLATADLKKGDVTLVNVWASWCIPCRQEAPDLMELAKRKDIRLVAINYKDKPENALSFLAQLGQPFAAVGFDDKGRAGIDWGTYGVPESYIVDGSGVIRFKLVGGIMQAMADGSLNAEIDKARTPLPASP
jgi:cytochrome c biogenesis protein CcmG/thiol:disulfide interchange protein DsbE